MNSIKIEKGAIDELKRVIRTHSKMDEFLNTNDKEPTWDGDIVLYSNEDLKAEHILYRIPTQVKGRNDESLLNKQGISYPVQYKNLRNYRNDTGVCYFVVVISDDGERVAIFYNALTPIKLDALLKGTERKAAEKTKNISLIRLQDNDKNKLYKILLQFGHDSKEQGVGELVRKAISIDSLERVDSIKTTTYAQSEEEALESVFAGEACLYGHLKDADIWLPFEYNTQLSMILISSRRISKPISVNGVVYYETIEVTTNDRNNHILRLGENITINTTNNKINFRANSELNTILNDIKFLEALSNHCDVYLGEDILVSCKNIQFNNEMREKMDFFFLLKQVVDSYKIDLNKRFSDFEEDNWTAINKLIGLYKAQIRPLKETAWYVWWWEGKVVPFFIGVDKDGAVYAENALCMKKFTIVLRGEKEYPVSAMICFKRDIWSNLYDIDETILLQELENSIINEETAGHFSLLFIEVLSAYDSTGNEKYYDLAKMVSDRLIEFDPDNDYWKVNQLQMLKRKRELSEEELVILDAMEETITDSKLLCAINILLDNKRKAQKELENMTDEDKAVFISYPIYNLL